MTHVKQNNFVLEKLLDNVDAVICTFLSDGILTFVNRYGCEYLQKDIDQLIGHNFLDLLTDDMRQLVMSGYLSLTIDKPIHTYINKFISPDGNVLWQRWTNKAIFNDQAEVMYYQATGIDITDYKLIEDDLLESEHRWRFVLEGDNDGIWEHDLENDKMIVSDRTKSSFGYGEEDEYNTTEHWVEKIHPDDKERVLMEHRKYLIGLSLYDEFRDEYRFRRKDGSYGWVLIRGKIVRRNLSGEPLVLIGTHSDITARKQAEEDLIKAKEAAEQANLAKSQFLANMSHELRTPLTEIIGMADFLLMSDQTELQREFINSIKSSSEVLKRNINDILEYSKIEEGKISLKNKPFNIYGILEETTDVFRSNTFKKGIGLQKKINYKMPGDIIGDSIRLRQVLSNIIGNAVKFTAIGEISILVDFEELQNNQVKYKFNVIDTGIGIEEENISKLFQRFSQVDGNDVMCYGGIGLGLAISKGLVEMMGGNIGVESQKGVGSNFYFDVIFDKYIPDC